MEMIKSKKGFSLVEMIIVMVTFAVILAAAGSFFYFVVHSTIRINDNTDMQNDARAMFANIKAEASVARTAYIGGDALTVPTGFIVAGETMRFRAGVDKGRNGLIMEIANDNGGTTWTRVPFIGNVQAADVSIFFDISELNDGTLDPLVPTDVPKVISVEIIHVLDGVVQKPFIDEIYMENIGTADPDPANPLNKIGIAGGSPPPRTHLYITPSKVHTP